MTYIRETTDSLTVFYGSKEFFILTPILALFALCFGFFTFVTLQEPLDGTVGFALVVLGLATLFFGAAAMSSLRSGWRRAQNPIWILRFAPDNVQINLNHPGFLRFVAPVDHPPLSIPLKALKWIRNARKTAPSTDDSDEVFVELCVSDAIFQSILNQRAAFRKASKEPSGDTETVMRLFEGNVIRVLIEGERWFPEIETYWKAHSYKIAEPFTFKEPFDLAAAREQPRTLL